MWLKKVSSLTPTPGMNVTGPTISPTVRPFVSGSNTSLSRMYPPDGVRNDAAVDHGPVAPPGTTARTRHVCGASNSSPPSTVCSTLLGPDPTPPVTREYTTAPPLFLTSNSYEGET